MLLVCDIGNSSSDFGVFNDKGDLIKTCSANTSNLSSLEDLKIFFNKNFNIKDINGVSISSVVPSVISVYKIFFNEIRINPVFISSKIKLNIRICPENPEQLGSDRIVNASYAHFLNQKFQIVVDSGTALTIDIITGKGDFLGGIIYPGLSSLAACLHSSTAKLPLININGNIKKPLKLVGTNSRTSILSGIYNGTLFLTEGFINNICRSYSVNINELQIIFTGGQAGFLFENINIKTGKTIDKFFTLKGIRYLYNLNIGC